MRGVVARGVVVMPGGVSSGGAPLPPSQQGGGTPTVTFCLVTPRKPLVVSVRVLHGQLVLHGLHTCPSTQAMGPVVLSHGSRVMTGGPRLVHGVACGPRDPPSHLYKRYVELCWYSVCTCDNKPYRIGRSRPLFPFSFVYGPVYGFDTFL